MRRLQYNTNLDYISNYSISQLESLRLTRYTKHHVMKKIFVLTFLISSAYLLSACQPPAPDKDVPKTDLFGNSKIDNSRLYDNITKEKAETQLGVPETKDVFEPGLTEQARRAGLTDQDLKDVKKKLAESFSMDEEEVQITAEGESTPEFMTGYVNVGESEKGGIYFAAKTDGKWELVHNGVGVIYCSVVEKYNFPIGIIPRCYDIETGKTKDRG